MCGVNFTAISLSFAQFSGIELMTRYTLMAVCAGIGLAFVSRVLRRPSARHLRPCVRTRCGRAHAAYDIDRIRLQAFALSGRIAR